MITAQQILSSARYILSPHHDQRPPDTLIDMIVIHNISLPPNQFEGDWVEQFFCGKLPADAHPYFATIQDLRVSAHLFIRRNGEIIQFVPFDKRAWHAGQSSFAGKERCNDFSIGIEVEGADHIPFTEIQYDVLRQVVNLLQEKYPAITRQRIVGHSDIAPGRKTDPGPAFDWNFLDC